MNKLVTMAGLVMSTLCAQQPRIDRVGCALVNTGAAYAILLPLTSEQSRWVKTTITVVPPVAALLYEFTKNPNKIDKDAFGRSLFYGLVAGGIGAAVGCAGGLKWGGVVGGSVYTAFHGLHVYVKKDSKRN